MSKAEISRDEEYDIKSKVSFKEQLAYGLGDGATGVAGVTIASFALYYYTDVIGISAALVGTILFFSRFFDAVTNIIMGYIVDRTNTKHGKARPWVLWTMVPFALALILVFSAPTTWGENALLIFVLVTQNIYFLIYTASNIPYGTLGALITNEPLKRNNLNIMRMLSYFTVTMIVSAITLPIVNWMGGEARDWQNLMIIYAVIIVGVFAFTFLGTTERVVPAANTKEAQKPSLKISLKTLFTNKYWGILLIFMMLGWSMLGIFQGAGVYYAEYILGNPNLVGILNLFFTIPLIAGFLLTPVSIRIIGRRKTLIGGLILVTVGSGVIATIPDSSTMVYGGTIIRSIGFSPILGSAYAMLADTIDYGEWKNGIRNDGLVYSGGTFSTVLGGGIASGGIGGLLGIAGYISGSSATQPDSVYSTIEMLFIYLPGIFSILMIVLLAFYNLDKWHPRILKDLQEISNKQ